MVNPAPQTLICGFMRPLGLLFCLCLSLSIVACEKPEKDEKGTAALIEVHDAWIRPALGQGPGVAYLTMTNGGDMDTRLIGAKSPLIGHAEIHMNMQDGHVMRMRAMAGGIELPAGETIELKPGGYHIMLFELNPAIDTAKTIPLTLVFAKGGEIEVEADVRPVSSN